MSEAATLVYLEADDEITTAVRRLRAAGPGRVIVIAPGRSRATSSAVALRLLARSASRLDREVVVVGDALTRSLAADAGLAAHASVEDARRAAIPATPETPSSDDDPARPRHAAIHVVRGARADETAPTMAAASAATATEETRPVPVARATPRPRRLTGRPVPAHRAGRLGLAPVLGVAAMVLLAGAVAGATLLPAATITIVPRSQAIEEIYEIVVTTPVRASGTVQATATIVASERYESVRAATGAATFYNFSPGVVEVPEGTLVAAGLQAFETTEAITVPSGALTSDGRGILAGEEDAPVVASAAGPDANVAAGAIDTVLTQSVDARLRGFPQNNQPRVLNAEPMSGGVDASGPEISEADVTAAVEELREELRRRAAAERPDAGGLLVVATPEADPVLDVPEDLVGMRDRDEVEIRGSLEWTLVSIDPDAVEAEAIARLETDPVIGDGRELLEDATAVSLGRPELDGGRVVIEATVTGRTAALVDPTDVLARSQGRSAEEARLALAELGEAEVELWPGWVASVPELDWRVGVRVQAPDR